MNWKKGVIVLGILLVIGILIYSYVNRCDYDNSSKKYIAKSVAECATIDYVCETNEGYFQDKCGCGCELIDRG